MMVAVQLTVDDKNDYHDDNNNDNDNGLFLLSEQLCSKSM